MLSKELKAMHKVSEVLKDFDNTTRQRVLEYVSKMSWSEEHKRAEAVYLKNIKQAQPLGMVGSFEGSAGFEASGLLFESGSSKTSE